MLLALIAFATMAPHFRSFDRLSINVDVVSTEILSMDLYSGGNAIQGVASVNLQSESRVGDDVFSGTGTLRFSARCISPRCEDFSSGKGVSMRGEIKLLGIYNGNRVEGQGTLSGPIIFKFDKTGAPVGFAGKGVVMSARVSSQLVGK